MLSLYNKIPDTKHIEFYSSEVSQEFQKRDRKLTSNKPSLGVIQAQKQPTMRTTDNLANELNDLSSMSNPYQNKEEVK